jgi:hypothetical protein
MNIDGHERCRDQEPVGPVRKEHAITTPLEIDAQPAPLRTLRSGLCFYSLDSRPIHYAAMLLRLHAGGQLAVGNT